MKKKSANLGEKGPVAVVAPATKDDEVAAATAHRQVPYGLADRCYLSDTEDAADAQRHMSASHAPIRDYVDTCVNPLRWHYPDVLHLMNF